MRLHVDVIRRAALSALLLLGVLLPGSVLAQVQAELVTAQRSVQPGQPLQLALRMQHDLQTPLPAKKRLRRMLQRLLLGRRWPATGEDEFLRKAVRRHEVFWVREMPLGPTASE